jgi:protein-S-isoprenylcysteine O-methyltransferase Ste14
MSGTRSIAADAFVVLRGVVVATLFVLLWVWLASLVRVYDPALGVAIPDWLRPVGWVVAVAGGALAASCIALFVSRGRGTPAPFDPPRVFVATGPYRYVRNPMYIGAILALLGGGLIVGSPSILLLALGFWLIAHLFVLLYEEPALTARFGETYERYRSRVNRWLPAPARASRRLHDR